MELNKFINDFVNAFDNPPEGVNGNTVFRDLNDWDSLTALSIIAMVDDEYDFNLTGEDIRECKTVNDLFEKISSK